MRDPDYSLRSYFADCTDYFLELRLYLNSSCTSSGRDGADEYRRTIGAAATLRGLGFARNMAAVEYM